jgi:phage shock protein E
MIRIKKYGWVLLGSSVGIAAGYLYWHQIGCLSGTCPITSNPWHASLYGGLMGGLLVSGLKKQNL